MTGTRQLILGRAGSGKSRHCIAETTKFLQQGRGEMLFLMPNRSMLHHVGRELAISGLAGIRGRSLGVFSDLWQNGISDQALPGRLISVHERQFILKHLIDRLDLGYLGDAAQYPGFFRAAGRLIQELKQNMVTPDDLSRSLKALPGVKSDDLMRIFSEYNRFLTKNALLDDQDAGLWALQQLDSEKKPLELLVVDGFSSFTQLEFGLLKKLIESASRSIIALCYDPDDPALFQSITVTYKNLLSIGRWEEVRLTDNHRSSGSLAHLEANLFQKNAPKLDADKSLEIIQSPTMTREVQTIASRIRKLVVLDGKSFSDIALLMRSTENYAPLINRIFRRYKIPHHIENALALCDVPIIRMLREVLGFLTGRFDRDEYFDLLKNEAFGCPQTVASKIQNFALKQGIHTKEQFTRDWTVKNDSSGGTAEMERHKSELFELLDDWKKKIEPDAEPAEYEKLLNTILKKLIHADVTTPHYLRQQGHAIRSLGPIIEAIKNQCTTIGVQKLKPAEFVRMFEDALRDRKQPLPPAGKNCVHVCNVYESRVPEYDTVFVIGLQEKLFPMSSRNGPFLKDHERRTLSSNGAVKLPRTLNRSSEESYLFYIAITRATRKLYLTCHNADLDGNEVTVSHYLNRVTDLFTKESIAAITRSIPLGKLIPQSDEIVLRQDIHHFVVAKLHQRQERPSGLASRLYDEYIKPEKNLRQILAEGLPYRAFSISDPTKTLLQKPLYHMSISRLETYGRCRYRYFVEYVLKIRPREEMEFSPLVEGALYHDILDALMRKIYQQDQTEIETLPPSGLLKLVEEMVNQHIQLRYPAMFKSLRVQVSKSRFQDKLKVFLLKEQNNQSFNATRPAFFELGFSDTHADAHRDQASTRDALLIDCGDGLKVRLSGRIDRVDIFEHNGEKLAVIIDYKKSANIKGLPAFIDGEVLQCPIYMIALEKLFGIKAVASFYYSIENGKKRGVYQQELAEKIKGDSDTNKTDICPATEFPRILDISANILKDRVRQIHQAKFDIEPRSSDECHFCSCRLICRR
jgi:ATP-dependent helicase/nuclease subunit B